MSEEILEAIRNNVEKESFTNLLGIKLIKIDEGYSLVEMKYRDDMHNLFKTLHGGATFSLIDEAFQIACNSYGTIAVALNVTITYHSAPTVGAILRAEAKEVHKSSRTGTYFIQVKTDQDELIASCQAVAYRKKDPLPFLTT